METGYSNPVSKNWFIPTVLLMPFVGLLTLLVLNILGQQIPWEYGLPPAMIFPIGLVIWLLGAYPEEYGWRGYALPRLLKNFSPLSASLILGILWGAWYLPAWTNRAALEIIIVWLGVTAFSVVFTWFYNNTMSLPIVMLLHAALNSFDDVYENIFPNLIEIDWELPYISGILLLGLVSSLYLHKEGKEESE